MTSNREKLLRTDSILVPFTKLLFLKNDRRGEISASLLSSWITLLILVHCNSQQDVFVPKMKKNSVTANRTTKEQQFLQSVLEKGTIQKASHKCGIESHKIKFHN